MSESARRAAVDARAEETVLVELSAAGGLADGTQENYRGWTTRDSSKCIGSV